MIRGSMHAGRSRRVIGLVGAFCLVFLAGRGGAEPMSSRSLLSGSPRLGTVAFVVTGNLDDAARFQRMAAGIWPLGPGDALSAGKLGTAVAALKKSGLFRQIDVASRERSAVIDLTVTLAVSQRIRDIRVRGGYPLFRKEVTAVMTLAAGDVFVPEDLPPQAERITRLFVRQGFPDARVAVTAHPSGRSRWMDVIVDIDRGACLSIGRVLMAGNRTVSEITLKARMKTWRRRLLAGCARRFRADTLKEDVRRLITFYRRRGWLDVTIAAPVTVDTATRRADIALNVSEGDRYEIVFSGNTAFSDRRLKKELAMYARGLTPAGRAESCRHIRALYARNGYLNATVTIDPPETAGAGVKRLPVHITEGPRTCVTAIRIQGNRAFSNGQIQAAMLTRPTGGRHGGYLALPILSEDVAAIRALYLKAGYTAARIEKKIDYSPSRETAEIWIRITEGVRTCVRTVRFTGLAGISVPAARRAIKLLPGAPFRAYMVTSDVNALSARVSEKGYPHVSVTPEVHFSGDRRQVDIVYRVAPGPLVRIGAVVFTGNLKTRPRALRQVFTLSPGDTFSLKKILADTHALQGLKILDAAHIQTPGFKNGAPAVPLLVDVTERKSRFLEAGSGYATDRGFFIHAKTGDRNLFGLNKSLWIDGTLSQTVRRAAVGFTEPRFWGSHLLGTPVLADIDLHAERIEAFNQTFGTTLRGANLKLSTHPFAPLSLGWGWRYEYRDQFRRNAGTATAADDPVLFDPRSVLVTSPSLLYDTRDSFVRPRRGIFSAVTVDFSKGLRNSLDDFLKYRIDVRAFYTPVKRVTLAVKGQAGYLAPYGHGKTVPDDQLFFLGGISTVRGFAENRLRFDRSGDPVGGRRVVSGSVETRIYLGGNVELALFVDTGRIDKIFGDRGRGRFRTSVGGGLRYITPIGPIGLVYGHKLDPLAGESHGRFHFSIGYSF